MAEGAPSLEVGFAIDTAGSYDELLRLQSVMDSTEAKVSAEAAKIERATSGMVNLAGANAQVTAFGNAATQSGATAAAAMARAEKAGEALSRQMERQIETFGMSRAAAAALRAEQAGLTELAGRLRSQEAALTDIRQKAAAATDMEATSARGLAAANDNLGRSTNLSRIQMMELGHVATSLADQLAAGANPARALFMEMGRIGQVASYSQGGLLGLASSVGAMIAPFLALAAGAGILAAAFLGVKQSVADDGDMKRFIGTLGLTKDEIEKLKDTTVTWGDVTKATFQVLAEKAGTSSASISAHFSSAFKSIGDFGKFSASIILASFGAAVKGMADIILKLPAIVGGAMGSVANLSLAGMEKLINLSIAALNKFSAAVNGSLIGEGLKKAFGVELPQLAMVSLGRVSTGLGATLKGIGSDVSSTFHDIFNRTENTFDQISARATKIRQDAIRDQANDIIADRTGHAAKAHRDRAKAVNEEADALQRLHDKLMEQMQIPMDVDHAKVATHLDVQNPENLLPKIGMDDLLAGPQQLLTLLQDIAAQARDTAAIMSDAFGKAGEVFGSIAANIADYNAAQQYWALEVLKDSSKQGQADRSLHALRVKNTEQALHGIKSLFKEHSTGYRIMEATERAYAAWQAIKTIKDVAAGAAKMFAELGPWGFAAVAAMVGVMAAFGVNTTSTQTAPPKPEDLQKAAGTGTVLGSPNDKSASIANSLEIVAKNTNSDLQYSNQMLIALRSIDTAIGAMAASVAKQINVNGSLFDTTGLGLGTKGSSGFLGLFSSSTTRTLYDSGIQLVATTVGNIISNGIAGSTYQIVEQVKKKSGFLGIGGGTKTSYVTSTGGLPGDITSAVQDVIVALRNGLVEAANVIGIDGASAMLDGFQVSIGKVSFKDMSGQEIEDQLNAIFSSIGDQMAGTLLPSLTSMQKVGEGLFETFTRVAKEYEAIDVEMQSIGRGFGAVGVGSIAARDALVQLFGGLDEFISATDTFRDKFLTDAEQIAPIQAAVIAEMKALGLAGITTREQFKSVVLGLDLTTDAGRQMYASLLAVAPAFDKVLGYFESANKTLTDTLQSTVDKFKGFVDSLTKYRATLFDSATAQDAAYAVLRKRFMDTAALAATGDATALGGLQDSAKSFLDNSLNNAKTMLDYQRDVALVARGVDQGIFAAESTADYAQLQLDAMKNAAGILQQISDNTAATTAALTQPIVVTATVTPATPVVTGPDAPATQGDIQALSDSINSGLQTIAEYTGTTATVLRTASRGDYLNIGNDPDSGLTVLP